MRLNDVFITRTACYLPNNPVSNDEIEDYLGLIDDNASKSKRIVLRNNGIKKRYYALQKNGKPTHSNAKLTANAIQKLFASNSNDIKSIDLLCCGTSAADQLMPSHGVMVHGLLPNSNNIEVVTTSGNCCSGMHALKYAFMAIRSGEANCAVTTGSERMSRIMRSEQFQLEVDKRKELEKNPFISFEKDFLRWMLSDGAGAFLLNNKPNSNDISLKIDWIEGFSYANEVETCMYMGAEKNLDGDIVGYSDFSPKEALELSLYSIKQDVKLLSDNIINLGFDNLYKIFKKRNLDIHDVDFFLPHMSSYFFEDKIYEALRKNNMEIPKEKWFTNLAFCGNVGAASIFLMIDELWNSGQLKSGQKILIAVPESARFSYVFSQITVV